MVLCFQNGVLCPNTRLPLKHNHHRKKEGQERKNAFARVAEGPCQHQPEPGNVDHGWARIIGSDFC
jgi:hypothetical protein